MGRPVVHFEVIGPDHERLSSFYAELFDWTIDADNPFRYGIVQRETNFEGVGIGGGIGGSPEGMPGHLTFYVEVPDVEAALAQAEKLGGTRSWGPPRCSPESSWGSSVTRKDTWSGCSRARRRIGPRLVDLKALPPRPTERRPRPSRSQANGR